MLKFLPALALFAVCSGSGITINVHGDSGRLQVGGLLGSNRCTYGPSYWCDHISKAAECKATKYCIQGQWSSMKLPKDDDDVCKICVDMVTQARDQLESNQTQEELKEVLEGSCNLIPIKLIVKECDTLVDDFIPELVEILSSEMNPQAVCRTAGLCNSERIDLLLADQAANKPHVDSCAVCHQRTESLKTHVALAGQHRLLYHLLPVCRDMGSFSDACASDMATNIGHIYRLIQQLDSTEFCMMGNVCPGLFGTQAVSTFSSAGSNIDCDLCIHIVQHWRDILVSNTTKEEFKEILDGICKKTAIKDKCTNLVDQYYAIAYDFLLNQLNAHHVCQAIDICSTDQVSPLWVNTVVGSDSAAVLKEAVGDRLPLTPLVPSVAVGDRVPMTPLVAPSRLELNTPTLHHVQLIKTPPRPYGNDALSHFNPLDSSVSQQQLPLDRMLLPDVSAALRPNPELCALCEFSLREIQKALMDGSTEDEITERVEGVCAVLPASLTDECRQFVISYGDFVITMLAQQINADQICPLLHICPLPHEVQTETDGQTDTVEATPGCALCEYGMQQLLDYLHDRKTAEEIRDGLDRLCDKLPHTVSHQCEELVNTFSESIIDMIVSGMTADEICAALHFCLTGPDNNIATNSIDSLLLHGSSLSNIGYSGLALPYFSVPRYQPESLVDDADDDDEDDDDDDDISEEHDLAEDDDENHSVEDDSDEDEDDFDEDGLIEASAQCVLCEFIMEQLKEKIDDSSTDAEIEAELKQVCSYLPKTVRGDCLGFMNEYLPAMLAAVKAALNDTDQVCQTMHLCPAPGTNQTPLVMP